MCLGQQEERSPQPVRVLYEKNSSVFVLKFSSLYLHGLGQRGLFYFIELNVRLRKGIYTY